MGAALIDRMGHNIACGFWGIGLSSSLRSLAIYTMCDEPDLLLDRLCNCALWFSPLDGWTRARFWTFFTTFPFLISD
jgi:hypothetical protein